MEHHALGADVALPALVDRPGLRLQCTTLPELHDARIAGSRHGAGPEVRPEDHRVLVEIGDRGFRLGELKAILDEGARSEVELPHHHRIAPATGEMQQAALERGRAFRAFPNPVLVLVLRQLIEVEEDVPAGS